MGNSWGITLLLTPFEMQGAVSQEVLLAVPSASQGSSFPLRAHPARSRAQPLTALQQFTTSPQRRQQHWDHGLLHSKQGQGESTWSPLPSPPLETGIARALLLATWMGQSQAQGLTSSAELHRYQPLDAAHGAPCARTEGLVPPKPM